MLNPFAHEYTPASSFPPEQQQHTNTFKKNPPLPKKQQQQTKKKKTDNKPKQEPTKKKNDSKKPNATTTTKNESHNNNKGRRKSSHHYNTQVVAPPPPSDQFEKESKFITIEAAIDPIRRIDTTAAKQSSSSSSSSSSSAVDKQLFEHGYEKYIDWIDRSLRMYDTVTLIGMDNAIIDIVSLVTILHDRKLGVHDDVETFSMDTGMNNRLTACIQVKLHPFL